MSEKTEFYAELARSLIDDIFEENSRLNSEINKLRETAAKYETLTHGIENYLKSDDCDNFTIRHSSIFDVYKALEPKRYSDIVDTKALLNGDPHGITKN